MAKRFFRQVRSVVEVGWVVMDDNPSGKRMWATWIHKIQVCETLSLQKGQNKPF
jgi:hypothetical protein